MRIMAFDYGVKRIGVAVTDPLQLISSALTTVHPDDIWRFLADYLEVEAVETFVVGKPLQMDGTASESAQHVVGFVRKLKKTYPAIRVAEVDERFTSKMASSVIAQSGKTKKKRQEKGLVDTISATLILQTYMESKSMM
ncbi:Holliday junction resolvase RuvX [Sphingobacterium psychroaquaticum]|uniref:Putative pre-16S rRNA nuclease n=1 Tax=Sphingobacterium psychroaquaticum TaxID=561061 RepID=A0A1X7L1G2_9SPHI|nr:Holliday junction resolvase RuvX [Sphingobacterium psychroaquaticum]QBQ39812.1 Holliday junction resolvase RuvX [Sphingobacterium psychroaquaticum]SMG47457.1 putative holliday junction resolvase [Sphingobacterium psychroaquaticum]